MELVTSAEVLAIIDVQDATLTDITPFITSAHIIVDKMLSTSGLASDQLKEIERWLSAHFVAIRDRRAGSESVGGVSISWSETKGLGLDNTLYGQQVKMLDTTGILAQLGSSVRKIGEIIALCD